MKIKRGNNNSLKLMLGLLFFLFSVFFVYAESYDFTYDANGNMVQGKDKYYEYNEFHQLVRVREGNSEGRILSEYAYDHEGNRIRKIKYATDGSNETTYYFDKDFIRMVNASGTYDTVYYHDGEGNLIGREDYDGKKYFYLLDHLGSIVNVMDETGAVVETIDYLPFGEEYTAEQEEADSRYKFTGKERDSDTGLDYYPGRYYDPDMARFIQPDPTLPDVYDPQSLNRYAYVENNPYAYVDPTGKWAVYFGASGSIDLTPISGSIGTGKVLTYHPDYGFEYGNYESVSGGVGSSASGGVAGTFDIGFSPSAKNLADIAGSSETTGGSFFLGYGLGYDTGKSKDTKINTYTLHAGKGYSLGLSTGEQLTQTHKEVLSTSGLTVKAINELIGKGEGTDKTISGERTHTQERVERDRTNGNTNEKTQQREHSGLISSVKRIFGFS